MDEFDSALSHQAQRDKGSVSLVGAQFDTAHHLPRATSFLDVHGEPFNVGVGFTCFLDGNSGELHIVPFVLPKQGKANPTPGL